jgi:glycosyltransferase involved in cell wall biosynthesis
MLVYEYNGGSEQRDSSFPLMTIAMIMYNRKEYVQVAVQSLLGQDYPNLEIVISDDHSNDGAIEIALDIVKAYKGNHRIVVNVNERNLGLGGNFAKALSLSHGEWVVACGGNVMQNPPTLQGVEAPTEAVITLTPSKFTFELEGEPENPENLKLIVMASAPQSNGVTRAYSKAVRVGAPLEAASEVYDLKKDYDEKNGVPTSAAPKVFMKYFFVNTVTGEKSGEMLVSVKLQEEAGE